MSTVTITKKEYKDLKDAKKALTIFEKTGTKRFGDDAFGILKSSFGKSSSINYIKKLRKAWR